MKKKRTAPCKVALEVHYDGTGHYPIKVKTMQAPHCHSITCRIYTYLYVKNVKNQCALIVWKTSLEVEVQLITGNFKL